MNGGPVVGAPGGAQTKPYDPHELLAVENLARTEALTVLSRAREAGDRPGRVTVFAGRGTAGAAALALARHLSNYGVECRVLVCGPGYRLSPLATLERGILDTMRVRTEELSPSRVEEAVLTLAPEDALVDGAGDANAPGREEEFAAACRTESWAGTKVTLTPSPEYRPPAPTAGDTIFSPDAEARSREDIRLYDSTAIEHYRIPGLVLMENAGWRAAREAYAMLGFRPGGKVLVLAGAGNNGGDGFVAARHLVSWEVDVGAILFASRDKVMDDAKTNLELAEEAGVKVEGAGFPEVVDDVLPVRLRDATLVMDALLGTGLTGKVRGAAGRAIEVLGEYPRRILAVDTPSGLDANTGEALGVSVRAERTVTFAFPKLGFTKGEGPERVGEVVVADISMPRALWKRAT